jgi:hypothetical protein
MVMAVFDDGSRFGEKEVADKDEMKDAVRIRVSGPSVSFYRRKQ